MKLYGFFSFTLIIVNNVHKKKFLNIKEPQKIPFGLGGRIVKFFHFRLGRQQGHQGRVFEKIGKITYFLLVRMQLPSHKRSCDYCYCSICCEERGFVAENFFPLIGWWEAFAELLYLVVPHTLHFDLLPCSFNTTGASRKHIACYRIFRVSTG